MKKTKLLAVLPALLFTGKVIAQEPEKPKIEIKPYGYVAYEIIMDTYKSLDTRDGEMYFYPLSPDLDLNGKDKNKTLQLQMLSLTTRLGAKLSGPDVFGAKSTALIETDFYATQNDYARLLRVRHAMINLKWQTVELLMGQYWHPIVVNEVIPSTISFGAGVPFHSLNRSPQIRITYYPLDLLCVSFTALTQGYHKSVGPTDAERNAGLPELMIQTSYGNRRNFISGISVGYKWLKPRLETSTEYATNKMIGQYLFSGFIMGKIKATTIKAEAIYGQNLTNLNMIGGYGMVTGTDNLPEMDYEYTSLKTLSAWLDMQHQFEKLGIGLFTGYSKLLGADKNYTQLTVGTTKYYRNDDLNYVYRVSPRVSYKEQNIVLAFEYLFTAAIYGETWNAKHKVTSSIDPVYNHRFLISVKYEF